MMCGAFFPAVPEAKAPVCPYCGCELRYDIGTDIAFATLNVTVIACCQTCETATVVRMVTQPIKEIR